MNKNHLTIGSLLGALAVALGAFGAHGLKRIVPPETVVAFQTGVQYQMYHALALILAAILFEKFPGNWIKWAGNCFITGIILFSGSLYLLTALKATDEGGAGQYNCHYAGWRCIFYCWLVIPFYWNSKETLITAASQHCNGPIIVFNLIGTANTFHSPGYIF